MIETATLVDLGRNYNLVTIYSEKTLADLSTKNQHLFIKIHAIKLIDLLKKIANIIHNKPSSIVINLIDFHELPALLQSYFKFVHAAGGLVIKDNYLLMIYKVGKWDLPKGHIEEEEISQEAALREVYEECGVKAKIVTYFYKTMHAFQFHNTKVMKETSWYIMDCLDDSAMQPQRAEGIEKVAWVPLNDFKKIHNNTYNSVKLLLRAYSNYQMLH